MRVDQIGMIMHSPEASAERQPEHEDRLDISRALYRALTELYPEKSITLFDGDGQMLAQTHDSRDAGSLLLEQ
jgi:hypothetical protein